MRDSNPANIRTIYESTNDLPETLLRSPSNVGTTQTQGENPKDVVKPH